MQTAEITYLGNEGVMFATGKQRVLIDALHGPYSEYVSPPLTTRRCRRVVCSHSKRFRVRAAKSFERYQSEFSKLHNFLRSSSDPRLASFLFSTLCHFTA